MLNKKKLIPISCIAATVAMAPIFIQAGGVSSTTQLFRELDKNIDRYSEFYAQKKESALLSAINANNIARINVYIKTINSLENEVKALKGEIENNNQFNELTWKQTVTNYNRRLSTAEKLKIKTIEELNSKMADYKNQVAKEQQRQASKHQNILDSLKNNYADNAGIAALIYKNKVDALNSKMVNEFHKHIAEMGALEESTNALVRKINGDKSRGITVIKSTSENKAANAKGSTGKQIEYLKSFKENSVKSATDRVNAIRATIDSYKELESKLDSERQKVSKLKK